MVAIATQDVLQSYYSKRCTLNIHIMKMFYIKFHIWQLLKSDSLYEYLQIASVEVPEAHMGSVVELLGKRRGQMLDMQGLGYAERPIPLYMWFI